jgi:hypothetical protein
LPENYFLREGRGAVKKMKICKKGRGIPYDSVKHKYINNNRLELQADRSHYSNL